MNTVSKATKVLFYKIHKGIALGSDYLKWAYKMIEEEKSSNSIYCRRWTKMITYLNLKNISKDH